MTVLGIDIGGSGIKGAPVDVDAGALTEERVRVETPRPATPDAVVPALAEVAGSWKGSDPVGVTFPGVVRRGVIGTCGEPAPGLARGSTRRRCSPPSSAGRSRCSTTPTRPGWPRWRSAPAATCAASSCC